MLSLRTKAIKYRLSYVEDDDQIPPLLEHAKSIYFAATGVRLSVPENASLATKRSHALIAVLQAEAVIHDMPAVCAADAFVQKLTLDPEFAFTDEAIGNAMQIYENGPESCDLEIYVMSCAILIAVDSLREFPPGILESYANRR